MDSEHRQGDELNGWKDIAAFLGVSEKTAMRWAARRGLPVRRAGSGPKKAIHASRNALLDWQRNQGAPAAGGNGTSVLSRMAVPGAGTCERELLVSCFMGSHTVFVGVAATLYAALYAVSLCLEIAYRFDKFGAVWLRVAPMAFGWALGTALLGLRAIWLLAARARPGALVAGEGVFVSAAALLWLGMSGAVPAQPVVRLGFAAMSPTAALLKNTCYFVIIAAVLWLPPYNFLINTFHATMQSRRPYGPPYPRLWSLWVICGAMMVLAIPMGAHLLSNIRPGPYSALYGGILWVRTILMFALALLSIGWYQRWLVRFRSHGVIS